jgi:hypothetical protein
MNGADLLKVYKTKCTQISISLFRQPVYAKQNEEKTQKDNIEAAKVALFSGAGEVTDEMWQEVVNFAKYIEAREAAKNENN